jgi:hypothetical protein
MSSESQADYEGKPRRFAIRYLSDIVYGIQPMPMDLAEYIRTVRREQNFDYPTLFAAICESEQTRGTSTSMGKALIDIASRLLQDDDTSWT